MTSGIIKSAQSCQLTVTTSGKKKGRKYWSEQFLLKVYIVVYLYIIFSLIIFSTVQLTSFAMRFARRELCSLWKCCRLILAWESSKLELRRSWYIWNRITETDRLWRDCANAHSGQVWPFCTCDSIRCYCSPIMRGEANKIYFLRTLFTVISQSIGTDMPGQTV